MYPHRIRLRGPWDCEPLTVAGGSLLTLPKPCRITMPCRWAESALAGFQGRVRFRRRFGYPGRIDAHERVWLTFGGASDRAAITLNGVSLGEQVVADVPFEYEVTALLRDRNELLIEVEGGTDGGLWGEVALEVRCRAFLREMRSEVNVVGKECIQLHVYGEIAGDAADMLELYMVLDRSTQAYEALPPPVTTRCFHLASEKLSLEQWASGPSASHRLRVDLVNAATVWHTWEQDLTLDAGSRQP